MLPETIKSTIMKKITFLLLCLGVFVTLNSQTINLVVGTTLTNDKLLFGKDGYNSYPRPFVNIGLGYTAPNGVNASLTYTLDLNYIISLQTSIPLFALKRKRSCNVYALINSSNR